MLDLLEKLMTNNNTNEQEKWFIERTNYHIGLVQNAAMRVVEVYPEYEEVLERTEEHDSSKFQEPERDPYILLSWKKRQENEGQEYRISEEQQNEINKATLHHIKNNSHHPEFHLVDKRKANIDPKDRDKSKECVDASKMPDLDVVEMVCDWQAMSEELGTNSARQWFDQQKDVRWHFTGQQEKLIDKILKVFEEAGD